MFDQKNLKFMQSLHMIYDEVQQVQLFITQNFPSNY